MVVWRGSQFERSLALARLLKKMISFANELAEVEFGA
jgi:hypothetical protein